MYCCAYALATTCPVLTSRMVLPEAHCGRARRDRLRRYAGRGSVLRVSYAMSGTDVAHLVYAHGTVWLPAMCGPEQAYGTTGCSSGSGAPHQDRYHYCA
eukprot:2029790-Rhodomonas_salina.1